MEQESISSSEKVVSSSSYTEERGGAYDLDKVSFQIPVEEDLSKIFQFLNRPSIETSAPFVDAFSIDRVQAIVSFQEYVDAEAQLIPGLVAAHLRDEYVALFFLTEEDSLYASYTVTCLFDREYPTPVLEEAFDLLLSYLFQERKIHRVEVNVIAQSDSEVGIVHLLQNAHFCFEGIRREAFKAFEELGGELRAAKQGTPWRDVMLFSLLSQEREESVADRLQMSRTKERKGYIESDSRLVHKAHYEDIDSIVVRAVIMKPRSAIHDEAAVCGSASPQDLCILLLKRAGSTAAKTVEELPGAELQDTKETLHEALYRAVQERTHATALPETVYLTSFDFLRDDGKKVREFVFRLSIEGDVSVDPEVYSGFHWVPLQHLVKTPLHPEVMTILLSCNDNIEYISETHSVRDDGVILEEVKAPFSELYDALAHGLHVNAYAARGFGLQQMTGLALRDRTGHLIGGVLGEMQYGGYMCQKLWVDPQFWGQGWEKRVIDRIEHIAQEEGARFIIFSCMDWEMVRPLQSLGYRIEWQRSGYDRGSKLLYLRKEIMPLSKSAQGLNPAEEVSTIEN